MVSTVIAPSAEAIRTFVPGQEIAQRYELAM